MTALNLSVILGQRHPKKLLRAFGRVQYYRGLLNSFAVFDEPIDSLKRYLTGTGTYPMQLRLKTPIGEIRPTLYSWHDMLTVNEIFCREDYHATADSRVIVDFGSNIGLSALYFLTRNSSSRCYLFEPVPDNVEKLHANLRDFNERFTIAPYAVALEEGVCTFGTEPTGRYGGIGVEALSSISVQCRRANDILESVLAEHGKIDILKIDIEGLEKAIFADIPESIRRSVKCIYLEANYDGRNPYPSHYTYKQYGSIAQFKLIE